MTEMIKKRLDELVAGGAIRDAQGHVIHNKYATKTWVEDKGYQTADDVVNILSLNVGDLRTITVPDWEVE